MQRWTDEGRERVPEVIKGRNSKAEKVEVKEITRAKR